MATDGRLEEDPPLVTALMPFSDPARAVLARKAILQFTNQIYARKQLVIANASGIRLLETPHPAIRELDLGKHRLSIGALRNTALDAAAGSWCLPWDDDDYYHPFLLCYHVAHRKAGHATLLTSQVRVNYRESHLFLHHIPDGIPTTIFFPRTAARYPAADLGEAEGFWIEHWALRTSVLANHNYPANCFSIVVHHGRNVTPAAQFMTGRVGPIYRGVCELGPRETETVYEALATTFNMPFKLQREGMIEEPPDAEGMTADL